MPFNLSTFGSCQLVTPKGDLVRVPAMAAVALVYLYYEDRPVLRRDLASILWSGDHQTALTNLRSTLWRFASSMPKGGPKLLEQDDQYVSVNRKALTCDLSVLEVENPRERLKQLCDGIAKGFMPSFGNGSRPVDRWVRDFRIMLLETIRSDFLLLCGPSSNPENHSDLKRAALLLLDAEPQDDEVRQALRVLTEFGSSAAQMPASVAPIPQPYQTPSEPNTGTTALPRVALLPPVSTDSGVTEGTIGSALVEDLTIGLCASRTVSVVAPYTSEKITTSSDKAALLQKHNVIYALDTRQTDRGIFAQLIFMPTDEIIWASRFSLEVSDTAGERNRVYQAIHDNIAERVNTYSSFLDEFRETPEAYFSYLQGLQSMNRLTLPSVRRARKHFKEALKYKERLPSALAGLSRTLSMEWVLTTRGDSELLLEAERLSRVAIEEDNMAAGAYKELGVSQLYMGKIDDSIHALSEAEHLSPHYADVLCSHADSLTHGASPKIALEKVEAAIGLNPMAPDSYLWTAAGANYFVGEYQDALKYINKMRDRSSASRLAAACWGMLGETSKARLCRNRVLKDNPDFDLEQWLSMIPIKENWQTEHYREGLLKAGFKKD